MLSLEKKVTGKRGGGKKKWLTNDKKNVFCVKVGWGSGRGEKTMSDEKRGD